VWAGRNLGAHRGGISATVPSHGTRLFRVDPKRKGNGVVSYEAESTANCAVLGTKMADCAGGEKLGNMYNGAAVRFNDIKVAESGTYRVNIRCVSGDPRSATVSANGDTPANIAFLPSGG
jgi:hypothetical protein